MMAIDLQYLMQTLNDKDLQAISTDISPISEEYEEDFINWEAEADWQVGQECFRMLASPHW